ncbi:acetoacetate decarboxylase family protein [Chengkuizengella sediminis]|uniref:acetoacetate decarboxylase family protein n=1 Tax=Chengkuizengella sediminis TaxID=1885917 RepID=UPI0013894645|nr:acetoacetate decarboxylase family protein [Chengkuizengella sediminis]NDI35030.1 acetoacetate decarboxylase family protein [Chengkuizengella sediminis]
MKKLMQYDETLLKNEKLFKDEFFQRFQLRHADKPIQVDENLSKNYLFPTFYGDVTCAIGIFMCGYQNAERLMPHPRMKPVRMPKGRTIVVFSCYEYKNVLGIPGYNEIAMSIPILVDPGFNPPILPMVSEKMFKNFGYYVFSMPVTSLENTIRGHKIWGLPKVTQEIDIFEKEGKCITVAKEEDGQSYFELSVPMNGNPTKFDVTSNLYSRFNNQFLQSETNFKSTFNVNKNIKLLFNKNVKPDQNYLKIGNTPSGKVLKDLEIEEQPFQTRFTKGMTAAFDLPNSDYKSPL